MNFFRLCLAFVLLSLSISSHAELTIEITKGTEGAMPVAIVPFAQDAPVDMRGIINADLERSGYFTMMSESSMPSKPATAADVNFQTWQGLGQQYMVIGRVANNGGQYNVEFQLFDVFKGEQLLGYQIASTPNDLRKTAHTISDMIFEKLTGKKGVFAGRIAYITSSKLGQRQWSYQLQVADTDGMAPQTITTSSQPLMSPAWSADGSKIAYVSFENRKAAIFIQEVGTGSRTKIAEFQGINGAPAWSPDSSRLALTLSKDGSPDIYVLNIGTRALTRLTNNLAIDTEPTWSPDGNHIVFTSGRGGKPQLYMVSSQGGNEERITFSGDYNAKASFSPDGKYLVMVHGNGNDYRIGVMDMASRSINVITSGPHDESPSFAPNGTMVLYASRKGGSGFLSAVSIDGKMQQKLVFNSGEVREPAWSPVTP
ncbi:Tol-Pal system protein TolB [uncultured bacterium]|nr:Tol-Pal system protein TolB [uncultured bacterium]